MEWISRSEDIIWEESFLQYNNGSWFPSNRIVYGRVLLIHFMALSHTLGFARRFLHLEVVWSCNRDWRFDDARRIRVITACMFFRFGYGF